jgi:hypothetical protein
VISTTAPGEITVGSQPTLELRAKKNGIIWDLTALTVQLLARRPDGVLDTVTASTGPGFASVTYQFSQVGTYSLAFSVPSVPFTTLPVPQIVVSGP